MLRKLVIKYCTMLMGVVISVGLLLLAQMYDSVSLYYTVIVLSFNKDKTICFHLSETI